MSQEHKITLSGKALEGYLSGRYSGDRGEDVTALECPFCDQVTSEIGEHEVSLGELLKPYVEHINACPKAGAS